MATKQTLLIRSLIISGSLAFFKFAVFVMTNSVAILALAADSFMDFMVSLLNYFLVTKASKPADTHHPYGHGKIESLAGLVQSLFIGGAAVGVAVVAVHRFQKPQDIQQAGVGVLITLVSLAVSLWHARNLKASMAGTESQVMASEYVHYASDVLVYVGVLVSLVLFKLTGAKFWDPLISILIVGYLLKTVLSIFKNSLDELLDRQLPDKLLAEIDGIIRNFHPRVVDYHDLRTRKVGQAKFIEFHVVLGDVTEFKEAHAITEGLVSKLKATYPDSVVTVHSDPEGEDEPHELPPYQRRGE